MSLLFIYFFFALLSAAYLVEMLVSVSRIVGLKAYDLGAAITLQSALALLSRLVVFIYMPLAGLLADFSASDLTPRNIFLSFIITPIALFGLARWATGSTRLIGVLITRAEETGGYFRSVPAETNCKPISLNAFSEINPTSEVRMLLQPQNLALLLSYVLYYATWPAVFCTINMAPDFRTTIFSCAALFTGLNTLVMALVADPQTLKYAKISKLDCENYLKSLIRLRVYGIFICCLTLAVVVLLTNAWV